MTHSIRKPVHTIEVPLRWSDMDAFGHVNNSVFFTYFEQARISWWQEITPASISFEKIGPVIINAHCTFLKALIYPEIVCVKLLVGPAGRSSYESYYEISAKTNPSILYAEGSTKVVWVDRPKGRSIELPSFIRDHLPPFEEPLGP